MTQFIPDFHAKDKGSVPFFEDNAEVKIPGRGTEKTLANLQREVLDFLTKLGAFGMTVTPGTFQQSPKRYGFRIEFHFANAMGRIEIAALPMRTEAPVKKERALKQALYLFRNKLEAEYYASMYEPSGMPLLPYLIGEGDKTVTEAIREAGKLPLLTGDR